MDEAVKIYFLGTAGSGKTALTHAFHLWMQDQGYDAITVNLDPGVEQLPYPADVDIREWISLQEVMDRYGLGPNGAQIVCADLIGTKAGEIRDAIEEFKTDYILVDTPGQMELFAFRETGRTVAEMLGLERTVMAFLFDPLLSRDPLSFTSLLMLATSVHFRFPIPLVALLSKSDILSTEELSKILGWSIDPAKLEEALMKAAPSMRKEMSIESLRAVRNLGIVSALAPVSAHLKTGMEDIYNPVQQVFMGGEDLEK